MAFVVIIVAVVAIIVVWLVFRELIKRRQRAQDEADALRERAYQPKDPFASTDDDTVYGDPRTLRPGDTIEIRGASYAVRGTLTLTQGSYRWVEHFIDTGTGDKSWISVEDDPDLEVVLWTALRGVTLTPGPDRVELDGHAYQSDESGAARFSSDGTTGLATGNMQYHDYAAGNDRLSFEDFGSGWECARGQVLSHNEYRIYPAGPATE